MPGFQCFPLSPLVPAGAALRFDNLLQDLREDPVFQARPDPEVNSPSDSLQVRALPVRVHPDTSFAANPVSPRVPESRPPVDDKTQCRPAYPAARSSAPFAMPQASLKP